MNLSQHSSISKSTRSPSSSAGFTLIEILTTLSVAVIVGGGVLAAFIQGLNIYHIDIGKLLVNKDMRTITSDLTRDATFANAAYIFPSSTEMTHEALRLRNPLDPSQGEERVVVSAVLRDGSSGDCLVLVRNDIEDERKISEIIVYFRDPDSTGKGPVRRQSRRYQPGTRESLATLVPAMIGDRAGCPEVVQIARGLSNGRLFYNFSNKSIIVKAEILRVGNMIQPFASNTYNFTISPRG